MKYSESACGGKIDKTALEVRLAVVSTKIELMQKQGPSKSTPGMTTTEMISNINQRICTIIFIAQLLKNSKKTGNNQMPIHFLNITFII